MQTFDGQPFTQIIKDYRSKIDGGLADYFNSSQAKLGLDLQAHEQEAFNYLREFSLRPGKRLRGSLALFAYEYFSGKDSAPVINAAIAVELVQNYLLIIDDVMDHSTSRRGQPTVHELIGEKLGDIDGHLAGMLAINVGLLASHMAMTTLLRLNEPASNLNEAARILQRNIGITCYGQIDDLYNDLLNDADEAQIIRLHELKNSYYSFIGPLQLGAAMAGAGNDKAMKEIERIGLPAGVAFQLHDDILGLFGDEKSTGKSTMDDLREGKFTLLIRYTFERATKNDAATVRRVLGDKNLTREDYQAVKEIVERCGALAAVADRAAHYSHLAKEAVTSSTIFNEQSKKFLLDLIDYVVSRKA